MIKLQAGERTDVGRLRTENEDSVWAQVLDQPGYAPIGLFIVCDGMGGHMGGKYASYWAVEAIKSEFSALLESSDPRATLILRSEDVKAIRAGTYQTPQPIETDLEKLTRLQFKRPTRWSSITRSISPGRLQMPARRQPWPSFEGKMQ